MLCDSDYGSAVSILIWKNQYNFKQAWRIAMNSMLTYLQCVSLLISLPTVQTSDSACITPVFHSMV